MTSRFLPIAGLLALALVGGVQGASAAPERRVVVVVDAAAGRDPAVLAEARAAVARAGDGAQLRVPRTPTEQLSSRVPTAGARSMQNCCWGSS